MINKVDLATYVEVDVEQMVADATAARAGAPVLALSRKDPKSVAQLCAWIRELRARHLSGDHTPIDPGPMAPHSHAGDEQPHTH